MHTIVPHNPVAYAAIRDQLLTGYIALSRPATLQGELICEVTSATYSHATMLGWCGKVLMLGETREHADARLISAAREFRKFPGYYDVFRVKSRIYKPDLAWAFMCRAAGSRYGWNHILRVGLRRKLGRIVPPIANSDDPDWPRDCSALDHAAIRLAAGPLIRVNDCDVVPGDLSNPKWFVYVATICWTDEQAAAIRRQPQFRRTATPRTGWEQEEAAFGPGD
jgi:hypothetical protein